jgi:tartrate dehydratase beta subunit/fumarate hydratase class I family protein
MMRKRREKIELLEGARSAALEGRMICSVLRDICRSRLKLIYRVGRTMPAVFNRDVVMIASGYHRRNEYDLTKIEE